MACGGRLSLSNIISEVQICHCNAISSHDEAVTQDRNGDVSQALPLHLRTLRFCEDGLRYNIFDVNERNDTWHNIREMQEKLLEMQENVKRRIYALQSTEQPQSNEAELPPPYSVDDPSKIEPSAPLAEESEAIMLLSIRNGVQLYFVSGDDQVGAPPPSYPSTLTVTYLDAQCRSVHQPEAILHVGDKAYPLLKNQMPVYKSRNGVYTFPNCNEKGIGEGAFGIVISNVIPREVVCQFEAILGQYGVFKREDPDDEFIDLSDFVGKSSHEDDYVPAKMSERITSSMTSSVKLFCEKIQQGSNYVSDAIEKHSNASLSQITPTKSDVKLNPTVIQGLTLLNGAAKTTVMIKNWLINWLRQVTIAVGQQLGPLIAHAVESASEGTKTGINEAKAIFYTSVISFGQIWCELEKSASKITRAIMEATVKNVEYRYGTDAGIATNLVMGAVASIGETAFTLDNLGPQLIADVGLTYSCLDGRPLIFDDDHYGDNFDNSLDSGEQHTSNDDIEAFER